MRAIAVIPARYASTRFPGKPLCMILGKPMIAWVVEAAKKSGSIDEVCVATDDERIAKAARDAGAHAVMTDPDLATGTDRVAAAAKGLDGDIFVNLQGDEPALDPKNIDNLVALFSGDNPPKMATLARPLCDLREFNSPDVVKVVCQSGGDALYFSRSPIPHYRDIDLAEGGFPPAGAKAPLVHVGIYAFTREALFEFTALPKGNLEEIEKLEQLRALEAGWRIAVGEALPPWSVGVDTPEDIPRAEEILRESAP